ncbi:MAG: response regulator [Thiotrichales bacterium]|nr:response regulator [Thiotrichales bacterium]
MNQIKFQTWMMEAVLWWRWDVDNPSANIVCSSSLQSLFDNPISSIKDLTGIYHAPIIDLKVQEILNEPDRAVRFIASYETKKGKTSFQHRVRVYQEGERRWVIAECLDVTEMVQLEREIVDAQGRASLAQVLERQALLENQKSLIEASYQKQSRFLALLSHELRSPLLGVKSMVNLLKEQFSDNEYLVDRLRVINLTTEQMTFLVNDILTYSQTEYDAIVLHPKRFSLKQTFEYVKQLTNSIAKDKDVFVSLVYIGDKDWVYGDSVRLAQILINLIVNGIKFTRYGGVSVEVRQASESRFRFQVMDSGEGIHAEKLAEIFDPFVQFKTEGSTTSMGSGLGLSVVKQLVEIMRGEISVSSQIGTGTVFVFELELPAVESEVVEPEVEQKQLVNSQVAQLKAKRYRVLVVDDSKINRMVLSGFLKELDCDVEEAADGQQAWTLIQANAFDFIFLDIQMPVMDGFEVMELIKQKRQAGKIASLKSVFAITAGGGEELIPEGQTLETLGFAKWFVKPISQQQVIKILSEPYADESVDRVVEITPKKQEEHIDERLFQSEVAEIPVQFQPLIADFGKELKLNLSQLRTSIEEGEWNDVKAKAHYIKGNCMVFQLQRWVEWLRQIELEAQKAEKAEQREQASTQINQSLLNLEKALKYLEKSA